MEGGLIYVNKNDVIAYSTGWQFLV